MAQLEVSNKTFYLSIIIKDLEVLKILNNHDKIMTVMRCH